jgi:uncharacterized protein
VNAPFWKTKSLTEMSEAEWESLCDGCGKCCLHKLQDEETGRVHLTVIACRLLDLGACRCNAYAERSTLVPECVRVRPENVLTLALPSTCGYRRLAEGRDLPSWHPLVSGDPNSVHVAGKSAHAWAVSESEVDEEDFEDFVVAWTEA